MLKINRKSTVLLSFAGAILSLAALLIFMILPTSDFANSIDRPAKDALMVLLASPVLSLLGTFSLTFAFVKDFKVWADFILLKPLAVTISAFLTIFGLYNTGVYSAYLSDLFSLGFVAPYSGTVYEYLVIVAVITVILKFVFSALISIAAIRNK